MSFLRRSKVGLDAKMNLQISLLEPYAAAFGETRRFGFLVQSQDTGIERSRRFLSIWRHCQLHVFDCVDFHFNYIVTAWRPAKKTSPQRPSAREPNHSHARWLVA